jgi:hypothetical protein
MPLQSLRLAGIPKRAQEVLKLRGIEVGPVVGQLCGRFELAIDRRNILPTIDLLQIKLPQLS